MSALAFFLEFSFSKESINIFTDPSFFEEVLISTQVFVCQEIFVFFKF